MEEFTFIMILLIAPTIIGTTVGVIRRHRGDGLFGQVIGWNFYLYLLAAFIGGITFEIDSKKIALKEEHYVYIKSLRNMSDTEGSFYLGTGHIESVEYYYFYYESRTGFKRSKIPVNNTSIVETNEISPKIAERRQCYSQDTLIKWSCGPVDEHKEDTYIMYVPKNTIIRKFKVY